MKIRLLIIIAFCVSSCDLFFKNDTDSYSTHDITISEINSPPSTIKGENVDISIIVKNVGLRDFDDDLSVILIDETEGDTLASLMVNGGLEAEDTVTLNYSWNTTESIIGEHTLAAVHSLADDNLENNKRSAIVMVIEPAMTDISIISLDAPTSATKGDTVNVSTTIKNVGTLDITDPITLTVTDQTRGGTIGEHTIEEGLNRGDSLLVSFDWNTEDERTGEHSLLASHNFSDDNAGNNLRAININIGEKKKNDIAVTALEVSSSATQGEIVSISATVQNLGNQNVSEDGITLILTDQTDGETIGTATIEGMEPATSSTTVFEWDTNETTLGPHMLVAAHNFEDDDGENNSTSATITINEPDIVDIAVNEVEAPSSISQGDNATIYVTLENLGNTDTNKNITITLLDQTESKEIGKQTLRGLDSGSSEKMTFIWETDKAKIGTHTIRARHDYDDNNERNDTGTTAITVNEPKKVDIAISTIVAPTSVIQGEVADVDVTIQNIGNLDLSNSFIITLTDQTGGVIIGSIPVEGLAEGESSILTFSWNTEDSNIGNHTLMASHSFIDENTSNNSRTATVRIEEPDITDIAVADVDAPSSARVNEEVTVQVIIKNMGNQDVNDDIIVTLFDHTAGDLISVKTIKDGLEEGESKTLSFKWKTDDIRTGDHTLIASHNLDDMNSENDSKSTVISITFLDL